MYALTRRSFLKGMAMGALGAAAGPFAAQAMTRPTRNRSRRVFLVTIDTLRADHCGFHGYPRRTTPFLDDLALRSVIFKRAFAASSTTAPSHAAILTGLYPIQTQVTENGMELNDSIVTLPELFADKGFSTAAFISTWPQFINFGQGFSVFGGPKSPESRESTEKYRPAQGTIDAVIEWLKQTPGDFFVWVHLFDPHRPHRAPETFRPEFRVRNASEKRALVDLFSKKRGIHPSFYNDMPEAMLHRIGEYDAEIKLVDSELKRLYSFAAENNLNEDSLWVIVSDHGEGLGGHGWFGHDKHIYNEQIHVPMIFHYPGRDMAGRVDTCVEHVDIFATLADIAGLDAGKQIAPVQGASLLPLFPGGVGRYPKQAAFTERRTYRNARVPDRIIPARTNYEPGMKFAVQNEHYKLIYRTEGEDEFFELASDPYELRNLAGKGMREEALLREQTEDKIKQLAATIRVAPRDARDPETLRQLRSLGYL